MNKYLIAIVPFLAFNSFGYGDTIDNYAILRNHQQIVINNLIHADKKIKSEKKEPPGTYQIYCPSVAEVKNALGALAESRKPHDMVKLEVNSHGDYPRSLSGSTRLTTVDTFAYASIYSYVNDSNLSCHYSDSKNTKYSLSLSMNTYDKVLTSRIHFIENINADVNIINDYMVTCTANNNFNQETNICTVEYFID